MTTQPALSAPLTSLTSRARSRRASRWEKKPGNLLKFSVPESVFLTDDAASHRYAPSQADVAVFKALKSAPGAKYPHAARWYKHIASFDDDFATLPGDASKPYTVYGPEAAPATLNPAKAPAAEEDDDDVDLFGSDEDEEEDAEAARIREERLAEYRKKKEGKTKPAAKSIVTMDVKPWGKPIPRTCLSEPSLVRMLT